jgi:hypothetical protein
MFSEDMPSMHLVDVADSFNMLGYYMYHGGNNPHSLIHAHDRDDPRTTLQESSFQPAGAQNPVITQCSYWPRTIHSLIRILSSLPLEPNHQMPSISYDFFAPLGEFGQPRRHYHQMRRLHLLIKGWGQLLADTTVSMPLVVAKPDDNSTVRWAARATNQSAGFLFVNNYQRLSTQTTKQDIRFHLTTLEGHAVHIPSPHSAALQIKAGLWFSLPFNLPLVPFYAVAPELPIDPSYKISWATVQPVARIDSRETCGKGPKRVVEHVFFLQIDGVVPEVALAGVNSTSLTTAPGVGVATEGADTVLRNISAGTSAFAEVSIGHGRCTTPCPAYTVRLVLLPWAMRDRVWYAENLRCNASEYGPRQHTLLISEDPLEDPLEDPVVGPLKSTGGAVEQRSAGDATAPSTSSVAPAADDVGAVDNSYRAMLLESNDTCTLHLRTTRPSTHFWMFPPEDSHIKPICCMDKVSGLLLQ